MTRAYRERTTSNMAAKRNAHRRTKPLRTLTLSDKAWARLKKLADLSHRSRSGFIEELALEAPLEPRKGAVES